jgi:hypothetical protein
MKRGGRAPPNAPAACGEPIRGHIPSMRRSLSAAWLLFAWLCANGMLLDVAQMIAWSRMFTGYVHSMPVAEALRETFDPAKPCRWCCAVQRARAASRKQTPAPSPEPIKLVLFCERAGEFVPPAAAGDAMESEPAAGTSWRDPVPVPPPKRGGECFV